jgi:hypothetical protein
MVNSNKLDFRGQPIYIGLDVHKKSRIDLIWFLHRVCFRTILWRVRTRLRSSRLALQGT